MWHEPRRRTAAHFMLHKQLQSCGDPVSRIGIMNNTKWDELRSAMYELDPSPKWRTCDLENGYVCRWDGEWFYHFNEGGYEKIDWCEIRIDSDEQEKEVLAILRRIHVPGERSENGFRIFGYSPPDRAAEYL